MAETITIKVTNSSGEVLGTMVIDALIAPPTFLGPIPTLTVTEGVPFTFDLAPFFGGKQRDYALVDAPEWLSFSGSILTGTAPA
jgi:hypothetical protein